MIMRQHHAVLEVVVLSSEVMTGRELYWMCGNLEPITFSTALMFAAADELVDSPSALLRVHVVVQ